MTTAPQDTAARSPVGTQVDGVTVLAALSPSRAADFRSCALKYRLRTIDKLEEPTSPQALRGTLVHKVLEDLFDLPSSQRTPEAAQMMVQGAWEHVLQAQPEVATTFAASESDLEGWLRSCRVTLDGYFALEDPRLLEPAAREVYVETLLDSKLLLRGYVDRIDVAPDGAVRVVDYKTGRSPGIGFESSALFQLRFYALVLWRTRGVVPTLLQLIYLGDGQIVSYRPDEQDLRATQRVVEAVGRAIALARESGEWQPNRGPACRWCSFQAHCPAFGNPAPPLPESAAEGVQPARTALEPDVEADL